jgi:hypothetical protein
MFSFCGEAGKAMVPWFVPVRAGFHLRMICKRDTLRQLISASRLALPIVPGPRIRRTSGVRRGSKREELLNIIRAGDGLTAARSLRG